MTPEVSATTAFEIGELSPAAFPHAVTCMRVIETYISWVVLTGPFAYKIKKPVRYDFLDASTLERRRELCGEELRLNRRLAPDLYVDVLPLTRESGQLKVGGRGPAVEYAVRMREFDPSQDLATQLEAGRVWLSDMRSLAIKIAKFHRHAAAAARESALGGVASIRDQIVDNLAVLERCLETSEDIAAIRRLDDWLRRSLAASSPLLALRKRGGAVRECHGDLHAHNIVRWRQQWTPFDCVEFNPDLRWIDVFSDVAFLFMDLVAHGRRDLAHGFLSRYLEETGDYEGLRVLPLYAVYRALVRAKVDALGAKSASADSARALRERQARRLRVAADVIRHRLPALLITHGVAASGKSWLSERLIPELHAVRVRSDLERKRLAGMEALEISRSRIGENLYDAAVTDHLYARLRECAEAALAGGLNVIIDAAFLGAAQREQFRQLAGQHRVPFLILSCHASTATLHARLGERARAGLDPSEATRAVLDHQLATQEALSAQEEAHALRIDTSSLTNVDVVVDAVKDRLREYRRGAATVPVCH
jgi:aminoglycoside phosphotransferase family enzyme/predicted kinase